MIYKKYIKNIFSIKINITLKKTISYIYKKYKIERINKRIDIRVEHREKKHWEMCEKCDYDC